MTNRLLSSDLFIYLSVFLGGTSEFFAAESQWDQQTKQDEAGAVYDSCKKRQREKK